MKTATSHDAILEILEERDDLTTAEIVEITGLNRETVCSALQSLRSDGAVHIHDWRGKGGRKAALWRIGEEPRAPTDTSGVIQSLHALRIATPGWNPFLTSMWNLQQGERNAV